MFQKHKAGRGSFHRWWDVCACVGEGGRDDEEVGGGRGHLREGEGHQSTTNHYKVQNVPQVAEVGALVEKQAQHHHLEDTYHTQYNMKNSNDSTYIQIQ